MTTLDVLIKERAEEIRSRISVLNHTLMDLERDFYVVFDRFHSQAVPPPFLFPVATFRRLRNHNERITNELESFNSDDNIFNISERLNQWNEETRGLLCEINRLQNVLSQRVSGIGKAKIHERQAVCEVEYGGLSKAYTAVDVFTLDLVRRTFGSDWIREKKYIPISLFDDRGYMINLYSYVISIPYYDNFRSRFWPILAHEVGHILVRAQARQRGRLNTVMLVGQDLLTEELRLSLSNASFQIAELTSDIISAYICPPSFLVGLECNSMVLPLETQRGLVVDYRFRYTHPPSDVRLYAMERVLELQGLLDCDESLQEISGNAKVFLTRKNLTLGPDSSSFVEDYCDFAGEYAELVLDDLSQMGVQGFNCNNWKESVKLLTDPDLESPSPVHTLASVWLKRLNKTKREGGLDFMAFCRNRQSETKTFEFAVKQMYKYYESRIVPRLRVRPYDIWIDLD